MEGTAYHSAAFRYPFFPHLLDAVDSENPPGPVPSDAPLSVLSKGRTERKVLRSTKENLAHIKNKMGDQPVFSFK